MQKTILYAVLNWGLGHATRSIPIINFLLAQGHKLIIASDGIALQLLQREFSSLTFEETVGYNVVYASSSAQFNIKLATQIPKFSQAIKDEHHDCIKLCKNYDVDYIISDNRYGFYHDDIPSAFVCHQLHLLYPSSFIAEKIINKSYQSFLKKFTELWVPDLAPPNNISKKMSSLKWDNVTYLGLASRFKKLKRDKKYDFLAVLSGPEPQRTILEDELLKKFADHKGSLYLVRGTDKPLKGSPNNNIEMANIVESEQLNLLICQSKTIICRAGYTSVLDLLKLKAQAILIPTPGQAEQEYLAVNLAKKKWFAIQQQGELTIEHPDDLVSAELSFSYREETIQSFLSCSIS